MKKIKEILFIVLLLLFLFSSQILYACTSFAGYSKTILYGMNFDYPDTELNFVIKGVKIGSVFAMEFKNGDYFYSSAQMNSKGLFAAIQLQFSGMVRNQTKEKNEMYITDLSNLLQKFERVGQVKEFIQGKKLFTWFPPVHILLADKYGDAMIVETDEKENKIMPIDNKFIVMTNFCNSDFIGKSPQEVDGVGSDRYQIAYEYLQTNINEINLASGLEILRKTAQEDTDYPTLCSMVFDPANEDVYIVLKRNYDKIWKLSMEKKTIESYQGFEKPVKIQMKQKGVLASELISFQ